MGGTSETDYSIGLSDRIELDRARKRERTKSLSMRRRRARAERRKHQAALNKRNKRVDSEHEYRHVQTLEDDEKIMKKSVKTRKRDHRTQTELKAAFEAGEKKLYKCNKCNVILRTKPNEKHWASRNCKTKQ